MERIAVVTGGNKGIGFAIVKQLCQEFDGIVYLTARDNQRGLNAIEELEARGLKPKFHQLDINDDNSVKTFRDYLQKTHGGLDVLVNNAAIAFKTSAIEPFGIQAQETIRVNYFSLKRVCDMLYPLLRPHARVVHLSSSAGRLKNIRSELVREKFADPNLTEEELDKLMRAYIAPETCCSNPASDYNRSAYVVSKVGVSALTEIHQAKFNNDPREDIVVNSVHPGYVDTDMTSHTGDLTPEQGAIGPVYCALLPKNTDIKGKYIWFDKTVSNWK